ncbi:MAG: hypothetical protein M1537_06645 [Nitrospirae bacterium]|nr:hypothetical protein [Nitrospirota bacterium]MCL5285597.1 hypothetical protein [Nitrospirota bacterium]
MERNYARGVGRGLRRAGRSFGRNAVRFFHLDDMLRKGIRRRLLDRNLEEGYRDLGEFLYMRLQGESLAEGDLALLDLMRTEIARMEEERKALATFSGKKRAAFGKKGLAE